MTVFKLASKQPSVSCTFFHFKSVTGGTSVTINLHKDDESKFKEMLDWEEGKNYKLEMPETEDEDGEDAPQPEAEPKKASKKAKETEKPNVVPEGTAEEIKVTEPKKGKDA